MVNLFYIMYLEKKTYENKKYVHLGLGYWGGKKKNWELSVFDMGMLAEYYKSLKYLKSADKYLDISPAILCSSLFLWKLIQWNSQQCVCVC